MGTGNLVEKWGKCTRVAALKAPPMGGKVQISLGHGRLFINVRQPKRADDDLIGIAQQCEWAAPGAGGGPDMVHRFLDALRYSGYWKSKEQGHLQPKKGSEVYVKAVADGGILIECWAVVALVDAEDKDKDNSPSSRTTDPKAFLAVAMETASGIFTGMKVGR